VQINSKMTMAQIKALPDNAQVRIPSGRVVSALKYKRVADAILKIKAAGNSTMPQPQFLFAKPSGTAKVQLREGVNLQEIAKRPDSDVLQMPDGNKITVGDLKKLSVLQQKLTGKSLLEMKSSARPNLSGAAIKVSSPQDIKKLADKPDSTILESASGKRVTLGELREYAKTHGTPLGVAK
jgi:hypothetical protein